MAVRSKWVLTDHDNNTSILAANAKNNLNPFSPLSKLASTPLITVISLEMTAFWFRERPSSLMVHHIYTYIYRPHQGGGT